MATSGQITESAASNYVSELYLLRRDKTEQKYRLSTTSRTKQNNLSFATHVR